MSDPLMSRAVELILDMASELHFRGCNEDHPLMRRSADLVAEVRASHAQGEAVEETPPVKLYLMSPHDVLAMDLEPIHQVGDICLEELVEAAFTFENQLTDLHGDDNIIPYDAYEGMTGPTLIKTIKAAVSHICRIQS